MKEVKEREAELAQKYRDRAKERRENKTNEADFVSTTQNFKTVAPEFSLVENAERRRQIIEESKFLGGDLEHTHLVKGLDYALLQKIKAELEKKQDDLDLEENQDKDKDQIDIDEKEG
jgi:IK cytokine